MAPPFFCHWQVTLLPITDTEKLVDCPAVTAQRLSCDVRRFVFLAVSCLR